MGDFAVPDGSTTGNPSQSAVVHSQKVCINVQFRIVQVCAFMRGSGGEYVLSMFCAPMRINVRIQTCVHVHTHSKYPKLTREAFTAGVGFCECNVLQTFRRP